MKILLILGVLSLLLIPIVKITYTHDGVCKCDGLDSNCNISTTKTVNLIEWITTPEEIIEKSSFIN